MRRSGATAIFCYAADMSRDKSGTSARLETFHYIIDATCIQEIALRDLVVLTVQDLTEALDGIGDLYVFTGQVGKLLCHVERL